MDIRRHFPRSLALLATTMLVGVVGLSLSVTAFGQTTTTPPLSDYTSTVPTPPPTTAATTPAPPTTPPPAVTPTATTKPTQASASAPATATASSTPKLAFTGFDLVPLMLVGATLMGLSAILLVRRRGEE